MRNLLLILTACLCTLAKAQEDKITGTWYNEEKTSKIKVYEKGGDYYGKIIWLSEDVGPDGKRPKRDANNPEEDLQDRPLVGLEILKGLEWDEDDEEWIDGEIYDPKSGNTYDLLAWMEGPNTLMLKGYVGFSLLGRSTTWTRAE